MKKKLQATLTLLMCLLAFFSGVQAEYKSIAEIYSSTPKRWQNEYQTKWRTVSIDVPVFVPDVKMVPIFRVQKKSHPVMQDELTMFKEIQINNGYNFWGKTYKSQDESGTTYQWQKKFLFEQEPDILPENSLLSYQQALKFADDEIYRLFGLDKSIDYILEHVIVTSCLYNYKDANGQRTFTQSATPKGRYQFEFTQCFSGIPYYPASYTTLEKGKNIIYPSGRIGFKISSLDEYLLSSALLETVEEIVPDVPLHSFDNAKAVFEQEIAAGRLRSVDQVCLCYIPYNDAKDVWRLIPAWRVYGGYTDDAAREFTPNYYEGMFIDDGIERAELIYQANTGGLIRNRNDGKIVTWKDIK
ncbi:MAG: DUF6034 family protein [Christensenellales bacterium]|jgi:hypothetical protein